jgi:hypothetical protein
MKWNWNKGPETGGLRERRLWTLAVITAERPGWWDWLGCLPREGMRGRVLRYKTHFVKGKGKFVPVHTWRVGAIEVWLHPLLTSALDGRWRSASCRGTLDSAPFVHCREETRICCFVPGFEPRFIGHTARSLATYRLSYRGSLSFIKPLIQGDSFGTRPKKMRISQRLFIRFWINFCNIFTYKYI